MNSTERIRQPWMHDMKPLVVAPAQLWETADGTVDASQQHAGAANIAGFYVGDTRIISRIIPVVNGEAPTAIAWNSPQKEWVCLPWWPAMLMARRWIPRFVSRRIALWNRMPCMSDMCCVA